MDKKYKTCKKPLVSVLMAVYNEKDEYLREAVESILNQSYHNMEIILVDDGSSARCSELLEEYRKKDCRVRLVRNRINLGLTKSLNIGLRCCHGKYIARMDSDDRSLENRIEEQVRYMERHPSAAVAGSRTAELSSGKKMPGMQFSNSKKIMEARLLFQNAGIIHSTAMIRRGFLAEHRIRYNEKYVKAQDYGLWSDIIYSGGEMRMLDRVLVQYRFHPGQITQRFRDQQTGMADMVRKDNFIRCLGSILSQKEMEIFDALAKQEMYGTLQENLAVISKIRQENKRLDSSILDKELLLRWWTRGRHFHRAGRRAVRGYYFNKYALQIFRPDHFVYAFMYFVRNKL